MFPAADSALADLTFQQHVREVIASLNQRDTPLTLPLDIRGTAFQQQVWQALRTIPAVKPSVISNWLMPSANRKRYGPLPVPVPPTSWLSLYLVIGWSVVMALFPVTAGACRAKRNCCAAKLKMRKGNVGSVC